MASLLAETTRRFVLGPGVWSLRASAQRAMRHAAEIEVDLGRLTALSLVEADQAESDIRAILAWIRQIQSANIADRVEPISSPLDFWGYTLRLYEDAELESVAGADDILQSTSNREGRYFRLPRSTISS